MSEKEKWELIGHSFQIGDTGDYDGHYELTNGKVSIISEDDEEDKLQEIVDALNESGCKFRSDYKLENEVDYLKSQLKWFEDQANKYHSLRRAVLEYLNKGEYVPGDPGDKGFTDLALSAGIVFENGAWKLKENSEDK